MAKLYTIFKPYKYITYIYFILFLCDCVIFTIKSLIAAIQYAIVLAKNVLILVRLRIPFVFPQQLLYCLNTL